MARSITVKVATPKVINALETKLAQIQSDFESQEANEAKYQKAYEKYRKQIADYAVANIKKAENLRTNYRSWNHSINIDFDLTVSESDLPKEPQRDFEVLSEYRVKEMVEEIQNALNILRMTDEEYVNASTMKSIAQYL